MATPTETVTGLPTINTDATSTGGSGHSAAPTTNTGSSAAASSTAGGPLPGLSQESASTTALPTTGGGPAGGLPTINTGLPTLPGGYSYPPPSVPPTAGAPYLASSNLPPDFVFIVVGAALAFTALLILGWRIGTAYVTNRSIRRSAKVAGGMPYTYLDHKDGGGAASHHATQSVSMHDLKGYSHSDLWSTSQVDVPKKGIPPSKTDSSLFFSPTAAAANATMRGPSGGPRPPSNGSGIVSGGGAAHRTSQYLASGYYAGSGGNH